ncbi:MAG: DUF885 family protein [Planctomycetota bacterium]
MVVTPANIDQIGNAFLEDLATLFPVNCASDEFYYFPHVRLPEPTWRIWDDFSPDGVAEGVKKLSTWETTLKKRALGDSSHQHSGFADEIDRSLLLKVIRTLREYFTEIRPWKYQPTFYLTIACVGLAEAYDAEDPQAKHDRAKGLPSFLNRAACNLNRVPVAFRNQGLEMIVDTRNYLISLLDNLPELAAALAALDRFEEALRCISTCEHFLLHHALVERIVKVHLQSGLGIQEATDELDQEVQEMKNLLTEEAAKLADNSSWRKAYESLPLPEAGERGLVGVFENEVKKLGRHCLLSGMVSPALFDACPVRVAPVPPYLTAIRTASSYSIPPGHPPTGGVFYIINADAPEELRKSYHREFRMLSAHETYPGHHLLDATRWSLPRAMRRSVEHPLFYEGWACFGEEMMYRTGYFSNPGDRLLLAKRRYWRAIRGKIDLGLQTGTMDIPTAAMHLRETGLSNDHALAAARKYTLNPGYQICYTLGIRRFLNLFDQYGKHDIPQFAQQVLQQGEVGFDDLEKMFESSWS